MYVPNNKNTIVIIIELVNKSSKVYRGIITLKYLNVYFLNFCSIKIDCRAISEGAGFYTTISKLDIG